MSTKKDTIPRSENMKSNVEKIIEVSVTNLHSHSSKDGQQKEETQKRMIGRDELVTKLETAQKVNEELNKQLLLEKARSERFKKKVQFIQENQDMFARLKEAYFHMKEHEKMNLGKITQSTNSQTCTFDESFGSWQAGTGDIMAVNRQDLADLTELVSRLKNVVAKRRTISEVLKNSQASISHASMTRKETEAENTKLKLQLAHMSAELKRMNTSSDHSPREAALLKRVVAKLGCERRNLTMLSPRESQLARHLARKYQERQVQQEKKPPPTVTYESTAQNTTPYETPRSPFGAEQSSVEIFSTPRWTRDENIP